MVKILLTLRTVSRVFGRECIAEELRKLEIFPTGTTEGSIVGTNDGALLRLLLGITDGLEDGTVLGNNDGIFDGIGLGARDGVEVVVTDGSTLG